MTYNQMNEARRQQNQSYMEVPPQIQAYADELGVGVIMPYNIKDDERAELATLRAERDEDKKEMKDLRDMIARLLSAQEEGDKVNPDETPEETVIANNRLKYHKLGKKTMEGWIRKNRAEIGAWPEENKTEIRKKYLHTYGQELIDL
jgi:cell division protein FtsB